MNAIEQKKAAKEFSNRYAGSHDEKQEAQAFWRDLLENVFGVASSDISNCISFEKKAFISNENRKNGVSKNFIDGYINDTRVLIEHKSTGVDLTKKELQSDGALLNPYEQAKRYNDNLPYSERARFIVTCNFHEFRVYDMDRLKPHLDPQVILLENLPKEYNRLGFLVENKNPHIEAEKQLSIKAGKYVGEIYDAFLELYRNSRADGKATDEDYRQLNILCVRLVFCLYAEDAGMFAPKQFSDFIRSCATDNLATMLETLFDALNKNQAERGISISPTLRNFDYVNGGLFAEAIKIPYMTESAKSLILDAAEFDWSDVSPTIFGAVFESTLNRETRRSGGMHYTSIENIHKVIDTLFLDELREELAKIEQSPNGTKKNTTLEKFREKLGKFTFLDPAAGSGNFLTETYLSLRRLENQTLKLLLSSGGRIQKMLLNAYDVINVNINQFYGIEVNDFAVEVAKTALWIAENQMRKETSEIINENIDCLPLNSNNNIVRANALSYDWENLIQAEKLNFIISNPPFVGARLMSQEQKNDMMLVFGKDWKNLGNLDYVCGWYKKCADLMQKSSIKAALVSTNSVCQGENVGNLWKPLFEDYGIQIDFAHTTFIWNSEATDKAHVYCVIVAFSKFLQYKQKYIYSGNSKTPVSNINAYLLDADNIFVVSRNKPLCNVPEIGIGNQPIDDGNYLFSREEMEEFIKKEPRSEIYFRPWYGAQEFIHGCPRYCLWLGDCSPHELASMPECLKRVQAVREYRLASRSEGTRKIAEKPTRFHVENMPDKDYIIIPRVSSEKRLYAPMGYLPSFFLTSDSAHIIPHATLYHFGVLTSIVHMAWMRVVAGRLKGDYRYSKDVVYNNFPWANVTKEQEEKIAQTAQMILDARALYPDSSLADLYNETIMPPELRKAHKTNDKAVMEAYRFPSNMPEADIVANLMKMYKKLVDSI